MVDNNISIKEQNIMFEEKKDFIYSKNQNKDKNTIKNNMINKNPKKRKRNYSPSMDIEENEIINDKNNINIRKKRMKVPIRKLIERINLDEGNDKIDKYKIKDNNKIKSKNKNKGIKIFSDMSVSEISKNLFKNFYPCLLPPYYPEQIKEQIIDSQLDKLIFNFNNSRNDKSTKMKIKINQNMDYLRELAEKQGEWISNDYNEQIYDDHVDNDHDDYDESDSNNENNSRNTYPEEESSGNENDDENNFEYDDYEYEDDSPDEEY